MDNTLIQTAAVIALLIVVTLPAIIGALHEHRISVQLRNAEKEGDPSTSVQVIFDRAHSPHEDRARRVNAGCTVSAARC